MNNENELQTFIADNPWLLSTNYEAVPELLNRGLEYQAGSQKRIDLILRDKIHRTPVIVEFKATPFYRENIGQILEYKARVALTFNKENSALFDVFKEFVLAPSLVLVVHSCDDFSRIACNLSGVYVYEFKNYSRILAEPGKIKDINEFSRALRADPYPLSMERHEQIDAQIYLPIKEVLCRHNLGESWTEPRKSKGYFFHQYNGMFINRFILEEESISLGIVEDIIGDGNVSIIFFSNQEGEIREFTQRYENLFGKTIKLEWLAELNEGYASTSFDRIAFFKDASVLFERELERYLLILNQMEKQNTN